MHLKSISRPASSLSLTTWFNCLEGGKWDVMRCELSPHKCCCPHLSPDSSSFVCVHPLPSAAAASYLSVHPTLWSLCLTTSLVPEWFFVSCPSRPYRHLCVWCWWWCFLWLVFCLYIRLPALFSSFLRQKRGECEASGQQKCADTSFH